MFESSEPATDVRDDAGTRAWLASTHRSLAIGARLLRVFVAVGLAGFGLTACRRPAPQPPSPAVADQIKPTYDKAGVLTKLEADSDHDGLIDTWAYMDGARVVRVEVDENGDGTVDRWEYHRQGQAGQDDQDSKARRAVRPAELRSVGRGGLETPDKTIERIERATRRDGVVSRWEFFENGMLTRTEQDLDGDGKIDKWETYTDGSLSILAIDTQHRGKPDRRLMYRPEGTLDRIEIDPTGSGHFQPQPQQPTK